MHVLFTIFSLVITYQIKTVANPGWENSHEWNPVGIIVRPHANVLLQLHFLDTVNNYILIFKGGFKKASIAIFVVRKSLLGNYFRKLLKWKLGIALKAFNEEASWESWNKNH